jgi:hypothetical protein
MYNAANKGGTNYSDKIDISWMCVW